MNNDKTSRQVKALGLCSGGLDSMLAALVLKDQGIDVTWVSFETPFFDATAARSASEQTGIPLIVKGYHRGLHANDESPKGRVWQKHEPMYGLSYHDV